MSATEFFNGHRVRNRALEKQYPVAKSEISCERKKDKCEKYFVVVCESYLDDTYEY